MNNECEECGCLKPPAQKNRKFCDWDCYLANRTKPKNEIQRLKDLLNEERECTAQMAKDYDKLWQRTHSKVWLLKRLLGLV